VLKGFECRGNRESGDKVSRAGPVSSAAEQGRVFIGPGTWRTEFLNELHVFPQAGQHDDQVDALSGGFRVLAGFTDWSPPEREKPTENQPNAEEIRSSYVSDNVDM
jgi:phage terminase large subunit-like protein